MIEVPWNAVIERERLTGAYGLTSEDPILPGLYFAEVLSTIRQTWTRCRCPYCQGPMSAAMGEIARVRLVDGDGCAAEVRVLVDHLPEGEVVYACESCRQVFNAGFLCDGP